MRPVYGALKVFQILWVCPPLLFRKFLCGLTFRSILWMCVQNLKSVALPIPEIIGGYSKNWGSPWIRPRSLFSEISNGLLLTWTPRIYRPNLNSVTLSIPEILAIEVLGGSCEPPILGTHLHYSASSRGKNVGMLSARHSRPKGWRAGEGFLRGGSGIDPPHQLVVWGTARCKLPQRGPERSPVKFWNLVHFGTLKSHHNSANWCAMCQWNFMQGSKSRVCLAIHCIPCFACGYRPMQHIQGGSAYDRPSIAVTALCTLLTCYTRLRYNVAAADDLRQCLPTDMAH